MVGEKFVGGKSGDKIFFWQICGNSGKNPLPSQTFACTYTYALDFDQKFSVN